MGYIQRVKEAQENLRQADEAMESWTGESFPEDLNSKVGQRIDEVRDAILNRPPK